MPNVTIAVGMDITIGNAHVRRKHPKEEEDEVTVDGITEDREDDEVEDAEGDSRIHKEHQLMLL